MSTLQVANILGTMARETFGPGNQAFAKKCQPSNQPSK